GVAMAEIHAGVILSLTGNAASLGGPARQTVDVWPKELAGVPLKVTILDDASDPTSATVAARKLSSEMKVDVLVGPSITPTSLAAMQVAADMEIPMLSLAGGGSLVTPMDDVRKWVYKMPPGEAIPLSIIFDDMKEH